jgi:hypothetical protein
MRDAAVSLLATPAGADVADLAGQPRSKEIVFVATSRAHLTAAEISRHTRRH